ncbi:MAG: glycosyltransferase family 4 protein [Bacteroidia bacterium]|nr:glycosyltransferase family 4 protein [Bacteroidia bacterium]
MRILILTQYYPPETGAPQNRLSGLALELHKLGHEVCILTAMPNYPAMEIHPSYRRKWFVTEQRDGINVYRSWIYVSKNRSIVSRLLNYFSFTFSSLIVSRRIAGTFDVLMCESPPLFLGISGWWISRRKKAKFVFNVSDLWPESAEKLGVIRNTFFLRLATRLEEFLYRKAFMVTGQTQGIVRQIKARFPAKTVHWLPNGVDETIFSATPDPDRRRKMGFKEDDFLVLYAGIIGIAQGLDILLDASALLPAASPVKFLLLGEGPEKERLRLRKEKENLDRVIFIDLVPREEVPFIVHAVDAAVIPLKKMDLFLGAIPSKIFENLALMKPIVLAVDGEARQLFIDQGQCGLFSEPENPAALRDALLYLTTHREEARAMGENGKAYVQQYFLRKNITRQWMEAFQLELKKQSE